MRLPCQRTADGCVVGKKNAIFRSHKPQNTLSMKLQTISLFAILLLSALACSKDKGDTTHSPTRVMIYMHDQPINYQQVNIDLQAVEIKGNGPGEEIVLGDYAGIYNLLDLQNGIDTLIADTEVNYSFVSQIRLILGPNNSVMVDSTLHPLQTPSAQQSGLKINVHAPLTDLELLVLSIDFDANESVHQLGNGNFQLHPVIRLDD